MTFKRHFDDIVLAEFVKIEKVLQNFNVKDTLCPGKICIGDLSVLAIQLLSQYLGNQDDFDSLAPTAIPLCNKLLTNEKIKNFLETQKSVPYCAL